MLTLIFSLIDQLLRIADKMLMKMLKNQIALVKIDRPIFIIGVERSGTTLLYSIMANHPELYWLSRLDSVVPNNPCISSLVRRAVSALVKTRYIAVPGAISRSEGLLPPSECLPYWRRIFHWGSEDNYLIDDDYFAETDVENNIKAFLHHDLKARLFWMRKKRLLFKWPGFSLKIRFLNTVFPDALFLHMIRNPVTNFLSLIRAKEESEEKFWGIKIPGWRNLLSADKRLQAAMQIKVTLETIEEDVSKVRVHDRYLQVRYESLIDSPKETLMQILRFCDLRYVPEIEEATKGIRPQRREAPKNIPDDVGDILWSIAARYGYA